MCNTRSAFCLLAVVCIIAGCSQTGGIRPGNASNMRTVASVGDKPLPSVSGEPGARSAPTRTTSIYRRRRAREFRVGSTMNEGSLSRMPRSAWP